MDCSCALRRLSLKIKQLSWVSLPSRADSQEILPTSSLNKPKSTLLKSQVIIALLAFPSFLRFLNHHPMILQPSHPQTFLPYSWAAGWAPFLHQSAHPAPKSLRSMSLLNCLHAIKLPAGRGRVMDLLKGVCLVSEKWILFLVTGILLVLRAEYSYCDLVSHGTIIVHVSTL